MLQNGSSVLCDVRECVRQSESVDRLFEERRIIEDHDEARREEVERKASELNRSCTFSLAVCEFDAGRHMHGQSHAKEARAVTTAVAWPGMGKVGDSWKPEPRQHDWAIGEDASFIIRLSNFHA